MIRYTETDSHKQFYMATANLLNLANPNRIYYDNAPAYDHKTYDKKVQGITELLAKSSR